MEKNIAKIDLDDPVFSNKVNGDKASPADPDLKEEAKSEVTQEANNAVAQPGLPNKLKRFFSRLRLTKKKLAVLLGLLIFLLIFLIFFLLRPVLKIKDSALALTPEIKGLSEAFQAQDLNLAVERLRSTHQQFDCLRNDYQRLGWLKILPWIGGFYQDGTHLLAGSQSLLEAGDIAVASLEPYADILGLKGQEEEKEGEAMTAEERLEMMLDTLDKIQPNLDQIGEKLKLAQEEVDQIDPNRYPEELFGKKVREKVVLVIDLIDSTAKVVVEAKPIVSFLKPLLGMPEEKKYLLIFQNDAELRPTGGFLTAYALLAVQNGNFRPLGSFDIYGLDGQFGNRLKAPQPILDYHKNVFYWHLRDMNLSPDFKVSMDTFWENFSKVGPSDVDAIIAVDTKVLVDLLTVIGPIGVSEWGNFSAENDARCDCPQVFYELELLADKPVGTLKTARKAVLGPLMHSILLHVMQSPRKKWPEFFNVVLRNVSEKHLLFYFFDEGVQKALEAMNATGRIKEYNGDYFHLNDCNFAGAKSNMFIQENVEQTIEINSDGTVVKTVVVDYRNPAPPSNCNIEAGELCLNGLYRDWVRLYVPQGSELIEATGSEIEPRIYDDLGKTVFEVFYGDTSPLRPEGKAQLTFKYKLPFKHNVADTYPLLIQKQPGTTAFEYTVRLNGKEEIFELKTDKELKL